MPDVLLGESRVYITDSLRKELGWSRGERLGWYLPGPGANVYRVVQKFRGDSAVVDNASLTLRQRGGEWYFDIKIPGVRRGRLNGSRTCKHSVENGTLVLDVRELLASKDP